MSSTTATGRIDRHTATDRSVLTPSSSPSLLSETVKPLRVKIISPNELLTAGRPVPIRCEAWGSFPAAKIVWLLDGEPLRSADITVHTDSNVSLDLVRPLQRNGRRHTN